MSVNDFGYVHVCALCCAHFYMLAWIMLRRAWVVWVGGSWRGRGWMLTFLEHAHMPVATSCGDSLNLRHSRCYLTFLDFAHMMDATLAVHGLAHVLDAKAC